MRAGLIPACAGKTAHATGDRRRRRAHPRACGENIRTSLKDTLTQGSSPRMRGKPRVRRAQHWPHGLIPAHAGKTTTMNTHKFARQAHPRACGENIRTSLKDTLTQGSSPRMRGKPRVRRAQHWPHGLIPAHAGKTTTMNTHKFARQAHPRACGENAAAWKSTVDGTGSSPRMRGKHQCQGCGLLSFRLIPACAGKTLFTRF